MSVASSRPASAAPSAGVYDPPEVSKSLPGDTGAAGRAAADPWRINAYFVIAVHTVGLLALAFYRPPCQTLLLTFVTFTLGAMGITMGYHRLWSHRSYNASLPLRVLLAFCGTLGFQASIKWWVLRHRLHHRYTDTDHDPYDSTKGFFFSHIGWIFHKPHYPRIRSIDISDLKDDPVVRFQHKHYVLLALFCGFVLPTLIASLWGDALGGYLWGGFVARLAIWHATFMINSFAHWTGDQSYAVGVSARGNLLLALLTMGEGWHNFHHEFPKDYRNGVKAWDWDPTKWAIYFSYLLGFASDLYRAPSDEIEKAMITVQEINLREKRKKFNWGPDCNSLPAMTRAEFERLVREDPENRRWVCINGYVLDAKEYAPSHPGGEKVLSSVQGKDASQAFNGGMNYHTAAARSMATMLRVAKIVNDKED